MDKKEYNRIHDFIRKNKSGDCCEFCGESKKRLDNALILGKKHEKNISNYMKLCRKCHYNYDHPDGLKHSEEAKIKIGLASAERIIKNGVSTNFINSQKGRKQSKETKNKRALSLRKEINHGTVTGYKHYKCRCEICIKANSDYVKNYRKNAKTN